MSDVDLAKLRELAAAASPTPWFYDSYCRIFSGPKVREDDAFWTDERDADGHTYDHRAGQTCPACGERPAVGPDGQRFGTYWDCERFSQVYNDIEPTVASVPPVAGDTAHGRHQKDAQLIEAMRAALEPLLDEAEASHVKLAAVRSLVDYYAGRDRLVPTITLLGILDAEPAS